MVSRKDESKTASSSEEDRYYPEKQIKGTDPYLRMDITREDESTTASSSEEDRYYPEKQIKGTDPYLMMDIPPKDESTTASSSEEDRYYPEKQIKGTDPYLMMDIPPKDDLQLGSKPPQRKESPFLSSAISNDSEEEVDNTTEKKQHDQIDSITKDKSIFNTTCKLYFVSQKTKKLETRGEGKIIILQDDTGLFKILMIRDKVMLKGCNHYIAPSCPLIKANQVKNSWVWTAINDKSDAEKNEERTTYFATFKNEEDTALFETKYNEGKAENSKVLAKKKEEKAK